MFVYLKKCHDVYVVQWSHIKAYLGRRIHNGQAMEALRVNTFHFDMQRDGTFRNHYIYVSYWKYHS